MKRSRLTITVAFVLIIIFGLLLFVYRVRRSEVAVITLFGKVVKTDDKPGPGLRLPWPIENVVMLDERIQNFQGKFEPSKLADQNILMLLVYVGWQIQEPSDFFSNFKSGSIPAAERVLEDLVRSAKNEVAGQHTFSDFISANEQQMKFNQIEDEIMEKVKSRVQALHYGVDIKFVHIMKIGLPESVTQNVFDRMAAERQFYISKIQSSGEEQASKIKSKADADASKVLSDADSDAYRIRAEGEAQMVKNLAVLQQNPELSEFLLQLNALDQLLKDKSTLILDQSTTPLNLLQPIRPKDATNGIPARP